MKGYIIKMNVVGLITEYNPFHNGHKFHIEEAKRITGAEYVVVVMSGNFVQRGAPAIIDKYSRTQMALSCGADLVFELPVCYATASAELFAMGAIALLHQLGVITHLCFGSECGDVNQLLPFANYFINEPIEFQVALNRYLREGKTFPQARMEAFHHSNPDLDSSILSSPNNILGIEYIKALLRLKSSIIPVSITRKTSTYHNDKLSTEKSEAISSATAIRSVLEEHKPLELLKNHVPTAVYTILEQQYQVSFPYFEEDFSLLLYYKLLMENKKSLTQYIDCTADLACRIMNNPTCDTLSNFIKQIKSKQWTQTRINRVLYHIILDLKKENFIEFQKNGYTKYARLLGFQKSSSILLKMIKNQGTVPVITKMGDAWQSLDSLGQRMLKEDIFAAQLYNHVTFSKFHHITKDEFTRGVILFP